MAEPPQDSLAEQCALGAAMISAQALAEVLDILKPDDFYTPVHETIFQTIMDMYGHGDPVDATTVAIELGKRGKLTNIGGAPYLLDLTQLVPTAANSAHYARAVADKAKLRRLVQFGARCKNLGETSDADNIELVLAQAEAFLREVRSPSQGAVTFSDMVDEWNTWVEADATSDIIQTPWHKVNEILSGGLYKSRLYVFGGRPGQGKSISALNIAALAAQNDKTVMIFSLEMPRNEVASRLFAAGAQVSFQQIIRRKMRQETAMAIHNYTSQNAGMKLYCVDKAGLTIEQIVAHCRAIKGLDMVVIDYVQLVGATDRRLKRNEQVAHVSRMCKVLAKDMNIAVVLAAQLNRQVTDPKTGKSRRPTLIDLGESGALEADADAVLFLHRPEEDEGMVDIVVAKNRSGLTGIVPLIFMGQQARLG